MSLSRNPDGPLQSATLSSIGEAIFWAPSRPKDIKPRDDDIGYIVKIGDRIDLIANRLLGTPYLWWVILHRNDLRLAPNDLVPGRTIYVPTTESLAQRGLLR